MRRPCAPIVSALLVVAPFSGPAAGGADIGHSGVDNDWFRAWPPASVAYSFPSALRQGNTRLGDIDTLELHAAFIQSVRVNKDFEWLVGADWYRQQAGVPSGASVPDTLQSAAAVLGFDWRFRERWGARLEVFPGVYSDFAGISGADVNAPFVTELSYSISPNLLIGGQVTFNARREVPVLGTPGIRWRFAEEWLLSVWFPRPRVEFSASERVTLFAGATIVGGTFAVEDFPGAGPGGSGRDQAFLDYREIRVGGGLRYVIREKLGLEVGGGWTLDRRYDFHSSGVEQEADGAAYVQFSFGLMF
jgi:hypothetical protein